MLLLFYSDGIMENEVSVHIIEDNSNGHLFVYF